MRSYKRNLINHLFNFRSYQFIFYWVACVKEYGSMSKRTAGRIYRYGWWIISLRNITSDKRAITIARSQKKNRVVALLWHYRGRGSLKTRHNIHHKAMYEIQDIGSLRFCATRTFVLQFKPQSKGRCLQFGGKWINRTNFIVNC